MRALVQARCDDAVELRRDALAALRDSRRRLDEMGMQRQQRPVIRERRRSREALDEDARERVNRARGLARRAADRLGRAVADGVDRAL